MADVVATAYEEADDRNGVGDVEKNNTGGNHAVEHTDVSSMAWKGRSGRLEMVQGGW